MPSDTPYNPLEKYADLRQEHPELFSNRSHRPIIPDESAMAAFSAHSGETLGVAATTKQFYFVVDLVRSTAGDGSPHLHSYLRLVNRGQLGGGINVVVLAAIADPALGSVGDIVLVKQERHAPGSLELELPRGFGEPGLTGEQNALSELRQETGYVGNAAYLLGRSLTDSGMTDTLVNFFYVPVVSRQPPNREKEEAITDVSLKSPETIWQDILAGAIRDGLTIQALALFEKARPLRLTQREARTR